MNRRLAPLVGVATLLAALVSGCFYAPVVVSPSLAPVDAAKPIVRYPAIQGEACSPVILYAIPIGNDSLVRALWNMERLTNVDGYIGVSVQTKWTNWFFGYTRCTVVTATPFTYGTKPRVLHVRQPATPPKAPVQAAAPAPKAAPRPAPKSASAPAPKPAPAVRHAARRPRPRPKRRVVCSTLCKGFGHVAATNSMIRQIVTSQCLQRCKAHDQRFIRCAEGVHDAQGVRRCNSLPAK